MVYVKRLWNHVYCEKRYSNKFDLTVCAVWQNKTKINNQKVNKFLYKK